MSYFTSDEFLATFVPILVYWVYSGIYMVIGPMFEEYRLHSKKEEDLKNLVPKRVVVKGVLLQQAVQAMVAILMFKVTENDGAATLALEVQPSYIVLARQFLVAMFMFDTWQYFLHRYMHLNKFLYKHLHSWHHRLVVPYSFGAQYNHPLEGLLLDTFGGALSFLISGMSPRASIVFFSFSAIKGIDDHCGLWLPWNPFQALFTNNVAYHDIHHQLYGNKHNFSQPSLLFGTKSWELTCLTRLRRGTKGVSWLGR
ncbi:Sphinganine C(4)-monooxygenase 2 [Acorus calamus]|uniref:aldehyde oxygenase (deformylating) n=1 Tax=Acorus calamus TaxID=4465 RepID=A0AAV9EHD9_ACOCL|nr:Sphinganine C(4)-monooxygenase 2 [Acorus calamus]